MRRSLLLLIVVIAVPVTTALAAFGDPEVADPTFFVSDTIPDQLQVDAAGRAYFVSFDRRPVGDPDDGDTDTQVVVYERCGTDWQVDSRHGMDDDPSFETRPIALEVAADGDALVVWLDGDNTQKTIFASFRPAAGDWGDPEVVDTLPVSRVLTDIDADGDPVVAYVEDTGTVGAVPLRVAVRNRTTGTWTADELDDIDALQAVAMSPGGDAIVLTSDGQQFGAFHSFFRPAAGTWGAKQEVDEDGVIQTVVPNAIAFAPDGKALLGIAQPDFGIQGDMVMTAVRTAGAAGTWSGLTTLSEVDNGAGGIGSIDAATHPAGVVLGWIERQNGLLAEDLGVARFNGGGFEPPKVYDADRRFVEVSVGAAADGRAVVAAQHQTAGGENRILVGEAQGIAGPWPMQLEKAPSQTGDHRDPRVGAGGITAVAYGVHAGNDSRSEVVADGSSPSCDGATPTATATATATATSSPNPQPTPPPAPPAVADPPGDQVPPRGKLQKVAYKGGKVRIALRLDESATVTFKVDGRQLGKKRLKAGTRKLALKPKKKLKKGRHRLTAVAVDSVGNRSKTLEKRFRVR
jgi:hypothetical protein